METSLCSPYNMERSQQRLKTQFGKLFEVSPYLHCQPLAETKELGVSLAWEKREETQDNFNHS